MNVMARAARKTNDPKAAIMGIATRYKTASAEVFDGEGSLVPMRVGMEDTASGGASVGLTSHAVLVARINTEFVSEVILILELRIVSCLRKLRREWVTTGRLLERDGHVYHALNYTYHMQCSRCGGRGRVWWWNELSNQCPVVGMPICHLEAKESAQHPYLMRRKNLILVSHVILIPLATRLERYTYFAL